ncbi:ATP synthase F1 subunit epsilon [Candidatus Falkowbacteria bacterium]|jgi:F-type H+-transporting ATPase subunit epsilon|nr:MAG: ATP synthase F1 subunit epsilon [Candidatus Falkowbacteria bacterium]
MVENSSQFRFEIASPERVVMKEEVKQVTVPTVMGEVTILPSHIPLVALLKPGVIEVLTTDGRKEIMSVSGGLLEVMAGKVVILADTAERAAELDEQRIMEAKARAEALKEQAHNQDDVAFARLSALIEKEVARGHAVRKWKRLNIQK